MTDTPLVSIIISSYNYGRFLGAAIDSALSQTYPFVEVIVVDDGSKDNSRDIMAQYGGQIVSIVKENGGQGSALNAGFETSSGEFIYFLDSDDLLLPGAIRSILSQFVDPVVSIVYWAMRLIDKDGKCLGMCDYQHQLQEGNLRDRIQRDGPGICLGAPTSGNAYRRSMIEQIFPLPESELRTFVDTYVFSHSFLMGEARILRTAQSCYRKHEGNYSRLKNPHSIEELSTAWVCTCKSVAAFFRIRDLYIDYARWLRPWYPSMAYAFKDIYTLLPEGSDYCLIGAYDFGRLNPIPGRRQVPLYERDGVDYGLPPDDATAWQAWQRHQQSGKKYLVFVSPSFWWFDHYSEFCSLVAEQGKCELKNEQVVIFST